MESSASPKVCFITAVYGNYEATCKPFAPQTVPTDFICFTDCAELQSNGWTLDTHPYHFTHPSPLDTGRTRNSLKHNKHSFNIAKYYKQAFRNVPRLQQYDVIVWLDGTIQITNPSTAEWILKKNQKIIGWNHDGREGNYISEAFESQYHHRYASTFWNNQKQPTQPCMIQADIYKKEGFEPDYFRKLYPENPLMGVWVTCFVAFQQKDSDVQRFLDMWYEQTLQYTTQDQIGFPYVAWKTGLHPYTLPDFEIKGEIPHLETDFYTKLAHGI